MRLHHRSGGKRPGRDVDLEEIYLSEPELEGALSVAIGSECGLR